MSREKKAIIEVQGAAITILSRDNVDYLSLTDMLRAKDGDFSSPTGCATAIPLSFSVSGSGSTTLILIPANSPQLKVRWV